jgi:hypothetical protein
MFALSLSIPLDKTSELKKALTALSKKELLVGFPEENEKPRALAPGEKAPRSKKTGRFKRRIRNSELAYLNEHGSPALNIPPRPFMEPGVESASDGIVDGLTDAALAALDGKREGIDKGFHRAGLSAQAGIKNVMTSGVPPALSPVTLMLRRRRGITTTTPLIASRQMFNAVTYVVKTRR